MPTIRSLRPLIIGILALCMALGGISGYVLAADTAPEPFVHPGGPLPEGVLLAPFTQSDDNDPERCSVCHEDAHDDWSDSIHANAFTSETFQAAWDAQGKDSSCLSCHTTNFIAANGSYEFEGVSCVACHGSAEGHPDAPMDLNLPNQVCKDCHTQTHAEFQVSAHAATDMNCISCHYAHTNGLRLETATEQCLNCHGANLEGFQHTVHIETGMSCRDCHGWVNPEQEVPVTGLGYTGHDFNNVPLDSCTSCHEQLDLQLVADNRGEEVETTEAAVEAQLEGQQAMLRVQQLEAAIEELILRQRNQVAVNVGVGAFAGLVVGGLVTYFVTRTRKNLADDEGNEHGS